MRVQTVLLLLLTVMLAGCADEGPDDDAQGPAPDLRPIPPSDEGAGGDVEYETVTLEEDTITIQANQCAPLLPTSEALPTESLIHEILIPEGSQFLEANYVLKAEPDAFEPSTIRMYDPDHDVGDTPTDEAPWSNGAAKFFFNSPKKGVWSFYLHHCDVPGSGTYRIEALVTANVPKT